MIHFKSSFLCSGKWRFTFLILDSQLCSSALCFQLNRKGAFNSYVVHCLEWIMWKGRVFLFSTSAYRQFADCNKILCNLPVMPNEKYMGKIHFFALYLLCTLILLDYKNRKKLNTILLFIWNVNILYFLSRRIL